MSIYHADKPDRCRDMGLLMGKRPRLPAPHEEESGADRGLYGRESGLADLAA